MFHTSVAKSLAQKQHITDSVRRIFRLLKALGLCKGLDFSKAKGAFMNGMLFDKAARARVVAFCFRSYVVS